MDDDLITAELTTALREQRGRVQLNTPIEHIISRGRTVRARRLVPASAAVLAGVAAAAAIVVMLPASHSSRSAALPGGHSGRSTAPPSHAQLAAWTVTRHADGTVTVTIRELRDPAQLQLRLRADGIPASVTFTGRENSACHSYPATGTLDQRLKALTSVLTVGNYPSGRTVIVIHPSALPSGVGVRIDAPFYRNSKHKTSWLGEGLVQASPQCTG